MLAPKINDLILNILNENLNYQQLIHQVNSEFPPKYLKHYKANDTIIYRHEEIHDITFLIHGTVYVINDNTTTGQDVVLDTLSTPTTLGLVEFLNHVNYYTAYVVAAEEAYIINIPCGLFKNALLSDSSLCYLLLQHMGAIAIRNMNSCEIKNITGPIDSLGYYLYKLAVGQTLPYVIPISKEELSQKLNINVRSLYRYLEQCSDRSLITRTKGKIIITERNYNLLNTNYGKLLK